MTVRLVSAARKFRTAAFHAHDVLGSVGLPAMMSLEPMSIYTGDGKRMMATVFGESACLDTQGTNLGRRFRCRLRRDFCRGDCCDNQEQINKVSFSFFTVVLKSIIADGWLLRVIFTSRSFPATYCDEACNPPRASSDNTCCPAERVTFTLVPAVCPTDASASLRAVRSREFGDVEPRLAVEVVSHGFDGEDPSAVFDGRHRDLYSRIPEIVARLYSGVFRGMVTRRYARLPATAVARCFRHV